MSKKIPPFKNGDVINGMIVLEDFFSSEMPRRRFLKLQCICGNIYATRLESVRAGRSCGCRQRTRVAEANRTHGESSTRLHNVWTNMLQRCHNPKNRSFKDYGARGIAVCPEWRNSYAKFSRWAKLAAYKEGLELDRIDNNGNYCPDNCEWVTRSIQNLNKRPLGRDSGKAGVVWRKDRNKWLAQVGNKFLGYSDNLFEAVALRISEENKIRENFREQRKGDIQNVENSDS